MDDITLNTEIYKLDPDSPDPDIIKKASEIIRSGGLVVFPTETVYGLGADATVPDAAKKIYEAKGRPSDNPLIIHVSKPEDAEKYAYTNEIYYKLTERFSPGPLTVILKKKETVPDETSGGLDTVAVRIPDNKTALSLIDASDTAIAAPSANISGKPSPTKVEHVTDDLYGKVDMILDGGDCRVGVESTVITVFDGTVKVLRPGGITVEQLGECGYPVELDGGLLKRPEADFKPLAPGMKYKHYSPDAEVYLLDGKKEDVISFILDKLTVENNVGAICYEEFGIKGDNVVYISKDPTVAASQLFGILRHFDKTDIKTVYSVIPDANGIGLAVNNRLLKAAGFKVIRLQEDETV